MTESDFALVWFKISINSVSSKRLVFEVVNFYSNILSRSKSSFLFSVTSFINWFKLSSKILYFLLNTTDNNCYSKPFYVTVKSMIVVFAESSGENLGFESLQVIKRLNFLLKSVTYPPNEIFNLLPLQI